MIFLRKARLRALLSAFLCMLPLLLYAQTDSILTLDTLTVGYKAPAQGVRINHSGDISISTAALRRGIRSLGEADAISVAAMMPGISSGSDYGSGLSVNGSDYTQVVYTIDGATVFFPYRFGGLFSGFNPNHLSSVSIHAVSTSLSSPPSVGGIVYANSGSNPVSSFGGVANVGMLASNLTLCSPLWESASLALSARASYLDFIYSDYLSDDDASTSYNFDDYNLSFIQSCGDNGTLSINGFMSFDKLRFDDEDYVLDTNLKWRNMAGSIDYLHRADSLTCHFALSVSRLSSTLGLSMPQFIVNMPSSVSQLAAYGDIRDDLHNAKYGYRFEYNQFHPQDPTRDSAGTVYDSWLGSVGYGRTILMGASSLDVGLRLGVYGCGEYHAMDINPVIAYMRSFNSNSLCITMSAASKFMHQVGFGDLGLASDFYMPAMRSLRPERSFGADVTYKFGQYIYHGLSLSLTGYVRKIIDCAEYTGNVLGILTDSYDPMDYIDVGDGYNVGCNVMLSYDIGAFSGWGGYSLAMSRRKYSDIPDVWSPSANEPMHSFKALMQWRPNRKWSISGYFNLASGRRYTPVDAIFIIGGNVLTEYGPRNSAHLPLYHRLDLSATYYLPELRCASRGLRSYFNFSLINAYGHNNVEMQYFTYNEKNNTICLRQVHSLYRFLPSISFTVEF